MTSDIQSADPETRRGTIRLRGVQKSYRLSGRQVPALRGINLAIEQPGFYAIMGPSGSGKSTLLHLLAGLDRPDEGTVEVAGHAVDSMNEAELTRFRRRHIGIVFQQFNLIPTMTALENVMLPGALDGMNSAVRRDRAMSLLHSLGLESRAGHRPDALSGGEQQRAAIARSLLFEPNVLLADEPTGNLDSHSSEQMWALLAELSSQRSMTVVIVTHEPAAAARCRQVFFIRDGVIADEMQTGESHDAAIAAELAARAQQLGR